MNVDSLIGQLSADLKPVRPLKSLRFRFLSVLGVGASILLIGVAYWYWRKEEFNVPAGRSLIEAALLAGCFLLSLWHAIKAMSPHTASTQMKRGGWVLFALWAAVIAVAFVFNFRQDPTESMVALQYMTWLCPMVVFSMALPAAVGFHLLLRQGFALYPCHLFFSAALASITLGLFGLAFICPWSDPLHELLWHTLPALLGALLLATLPFGISIRKSK